MKVTTTLNAIVTRRRVLRPMKNPSLALVSILTLPIFHLYARRSAYSYRSIYIVFKTRILLHISDSHVRDVDYNERRVSCYKQLNHCAAIDS